MFTDDSKSGYSKEEVSCEENGDIVRNVYHQTAVGHIFNKLEKVLPLVLWKVLPI